MIRQFYDLQEQEKIDKEARAVDETGFSHQEVQDFRELFVASDRDKDQELSLGDVKRLVGNICTLDEKSTKSLVAAFQEARGPRAKAVGHPELLDFPEFLCLMRHL